MHIFREFVTLITSTSLKMTAGKIKSIIIRVEEIIEENKCLEKKEETLAKKRKENVKWVEELIKENKSLEEKEEILIKKRQENVNEIRNLLNESKRVPSGATSAADGNGSIVKEDVKGDGGKSMQDIKIEVQMDLMDEEEPTPSRLNVSRKRNLDEFVPDCGKIVKKIPRKELAAITPRKLKVEDESPEASLKCNFDNCSRSFTCASTLVSHLQNHAAEKKAKFQCPLVGCGYSNTSESLLTHIRGKHTGEELFSCESCPKKFHSMAAKVQHDWKHSRPHLWAQCARQDCLKFCQIAK